MRSSHGHRIDSFTRMQMLFTLGNIGGTRRLLFQVDIKISQYHDIRPRSDWLEVVNDPSTS